MQDLERSVVLITGADDHNTRFGTGFAVASNGINTLVVTCAHVVDDVGGTDQVRIGGQGVTVRAIGNADAVDLAVLEVPVAMSGEGVLPLEDSLLPQGRGFVSVGFQRYGVHFLLRRIIGSFGAEVRLEAVRGIRVRAWELVMGGDSRLQPGYSGSPVIDHSTGQVVAVASHRESDGQRGLAIAVGGLDDIWPDRSAHVSITSVPVASTRSRTSHLITDDSPVFVGRDRELSLVKAKLAASHAGEGNVGFLVGEAGAGKTTLTMKALASMATESQPAIVAIARADAVSGRHLSYGPFKDVMEQVLEWSDDAAGASPAPIDLVSNVLSEMGLADLGPLASFTGSRTRALQQKLRAVGGYAKGPDTNLGEVNQGVLFDCYTKALTAVAAHYPVVVVLEDVQWVDESSLLLLMHLGRTISSHRMIVLCTMRKEGMEELNPLLTEVQDRLGALGAFTVDLNWRTAEDSQSDEPLRRFCIDYLTARYGTPFSPEFPAALYRLTKANPLFLAETLVNLEERGIIRRDNGRWVLTQALNDIRHLPVRIEQVIRQRVSRLDDTLVSILKHGSIEGETFTAEVVARIQGLEERAMLRTVIDKLMRAHQLVLSGIRRRLLNGTRVHTFNFHHAMTQRYVYEYLLSPIEREMLHEEVATCLEEMWGDSANDVAPQLATHYWHANLPEKAITYALRAGEKFIDQYGWSEAARFARLGLDACAASSEVARTVPVDILIRLSLVYARSEAEGGIRGEAIDHIQAGIDALRPYLDQAAVIDDRLAAEVNLTFGRLIASKEVTAAYDSNEYLDEAARIYERLGDTDGVIAALSVACYDTNLADQDSAADQLVRRRRCVNLAESLNRPLLLSKSLSDLALHYLNFDSETERPLELALDAACRSVAIASSHNAIAELNAQLILSWVHHHCGHYDQLLAHRQNLLDLARRHGQTIFEAEALTDLGHYYSLTTSTQDIADRVMREALAFRHQIGRHTVHDRENLAAFLIRRGDFESGIKLHLQSLDEESPQRAARSRGIIAYVLAITGRTVEAREMLREADMLAAESEHHDGAARMRAHALLGNVDAARSLAEVGSRHVAGSAARGMFHLYVDHATELAETHRLIEAPKTAATWIDEAASHWAHLAETTDVTKLVMYWEHRLVVGKVSVMLGELDAARTTLKQVISEFSRAGHHAQAEAWLYLGLAQEPLERSLIRECLDTSARRAKELGVEYVAALTAQHMEAHDEADRTA